MNRILIFWFVYALGVELTYTNATTTYRLLPIVSKDCQPQLIQGAERDVFLKKLAEQGTESWVATGASQQQ